MAKDIVNLPKDATGDEIFEEVAGSIDAALDLLCEEYGNTAVLNTDWGISTARTVGNHILNGKTED